MDFREKLMVRPGQKVRLKDFDPDDTHGFKKDDESEAFTAKSIARIDELQYILYAENKRALLIMLQAIDSGGKDGTIRHVMSGANPQGCKVSSFKVPSAEEARHDFLWRFHQAVPASGEIGIFNRSPYEQVLVVRVHELLPKKEWSAAYEQINGFERFLAESDVTILKFFLHISKDEQKRRLQQRLDEPEKHWKVSPADFTERRYWDDYMAAYEAVLERCSTDHAPWFVIPATKKWFRNLAVSRIIAETMDSMNLKFPVSTLKLPKKVPE